MSILLSNLPVEKHAPVSTADQVCLAHELVDRHDLRVPAGFFHVKENVDTVIRTLAYHPDAEFPDRTGFGIENHLRKFYFTSDDVSWITRKLNDFVDDKKYKFETSHVELLITLFNNSDHPLQIEDINVDPEEERFQRELKDVEESVF